MLQSLSAGRRRFGIVGLALVGLMAISAPSTALAATPTPYTATFQEQTTFLQSCPAGVPAGSTCFVGVGHGASTPPGDPNAVENFAGYVTPTGMDANVVSISTNRGTLFMTTQGQVGVNSEMGTWTAHGGTGIFTGATGSGAVNTVEGPPNNNGTVSSTTNYGPATLILR